MLKYHFPSCRGSTATVTRPDRLQEGLDAREIRAEICNHAHRRMAPRAWELNDDDVVHTELTAKLILQSKAAAAPARGCLICEVTVEGRPELRAAELKP
jgi:hypothetical protein